MSKQEKRNQGAEAAPASASRRLPRAHIPGWMLIPLLFICIWEIAARIASTPWLFPPFTTVLDELLHPFRTRLASGSLFDNTLISLVRVMTGFFFAALFGVPGGVLLGAHRTLRRLFEPLVELFRPLCPIAWIPFAIAIFKLQTIPQLFGASFSNTILDHVQLGMVFVLFWGGFFPIITNTIDGVSGVRRNYLHLAYTLGANRFQTFVHVHIPAALPMIITGLRQGIGTCWFVIIAAEMLPGSESGIGYLLMYASDQCAMDIVIACMILIGCMGAFLTFALQKTASCFIGWHGKEV